MAAETIAAAGAQVTVFDRMPSPARKLLMAGRGGLNLTHSGPLDAFLTQYGPARPHLEAAIRAFPPEALVAWCTGLGQETFIGSSGRVFPRTLKASPLLRAWLQRLDSLGVALRPRHLWQGWDETGALRFVAPDGVHTLRPDATVLALGGASWPRLGSDGGWTALLADTPIAPLRPANCGFAVVWSEHFRSRHEGTPLKRIALRFDGIVVRGEAVITAAGIEGGAIYALSARLRDAIAERGPVVAELDLRPALHLNLAGLKELDTAGVQLLVWLKQEARRRNRTLALSAHSPAVVEVFDLLQVASLFGDAILIAPSPS